MEADTEHGKALYADLERQKTIAETDFQDVRQDSIGQQNRKSQFLDQVSVQAPSAFHASLAAKGISVENPHYRKILEAVLYQNSHFNPLKRHGEEQKTWLHLAIEKRKIDVVDVFLTWCIHHHRNPIIAQVRELATLAGDTILHGIAKQLAQSNEQDIVVVSELFQSILTKLMIILREEASHQFHNDHKLLDRRANQLLMTALLQQNRAQKTAIDYLLQSNKYGLFSLLTRDYVTFDVIEEAIRTKHLANTDLRQAMFLALKKYSVTLKELHAFWFYKEKVAARLITFDAVPVVQLKDSYPDRIAVRSRDYLALMIALYQSILNDGISDLLQEIQKRWAFSRDSSRKAFFAISSRETVLFDPLMQLIGDFMRGNLSGPMQRLNTHHESFEEALRYASLAKDAKIEADAVVIKGASLQLAAFETEQNRRLEEQAALHRAETRVQLAEQAVKFELSLGEIRAQLLEHQRNPIEAEPIAASAAGNNQMLGQGARFKMFSPANDATMGYSLVFLKLAALPKLNRAVLEGIFQGKDGMLLVEDRLYSLKQSERCLEEIPVTDENRIEMVQVKSLFADERSVLISKSTDLILVASLLDDSMSLASANRS